MTTSLSCFSESAVQLIAGFDPARGGSWVVLGSAHVVWVALAAISSLGGIGSTVVVWETGCMLGSSLPLEVRALSCVTVVAVAVAVSDGIRIDASGVVVAAVSLSLFIRVDAFGSGRAAVAGGGVGVVDELKPVSISHRSRFHGCSFKLPVLIMITVRNSIPCP